MRSTATKLANSASRSGLRRAKGQPCTLCRYAASSVALTLASRGTK